jgi:hypothetical protein
MTESKLKTPEGMHTITPHIVVNDVSLDQLTQLRQTEQILRSLVTTLSQDRNPAASMGFGFHGAPSGKRMMSGMPGWAGRGSYWPGHSHREKGETR